MFLVQNFDSTFKSRGNIYINMYKDACMCGRMCKCSIILIEVTSFLFLYTRIVAYCVFLPVFFSFLYVIVYRDKIKEEGNDQESIQLNTTPHPRHHMGK